MSELNGWIRIGDQVGGNGRWMVYRHRGGRFDSLVESGVFTIDQAEAAQKFFKQKAGIRRGGMWLVSPDGYVVDLVFNR